MKRENSSTDWRKINARKAQEEIRTLTRPDGCTPQRWRCVVDLLCALVEYLPDPYPGQDRLARELGIGHRTVQRWVSWAVELGLLVVSPGASYHGHWAHNEYRVIGISTVRHIGVPTVGHIGAQSSSYSRMKRSNPSSSRRGSKTEVSVDSVAGRKVSMSDYDPSFSEGAPEEYLEEARPSLKRKRTPVGEVTHHFREEWDKRLAQPGGTFLDSMTLFDSVAAFQACVKREYIDKGKSAAEVCASIDLFLRQVDARRMLPKDGQPVWKLWWNRRAQFQRIPVEESTLRIPTLEDQKRRYEERYGSA